MRGLVTLTRRPNSSNVSEDDVSERLPFPERQNKIAGNLQVTKNQNKRKKKQSIKKTKKSKRKERLKRKANGRKKQKNKEDRMTGN